MSQQSFHQQTANGSNIAFTITTFSEDEIKVYVDGVESTNGGSNQNDYTISNYTTTGGTVTWNTSGSLTAPASPSVVRVVRQTDVMNNGNTAVEGRATFQAGSSVKANDLNNNTKQTLRALQEQQDQKVQSYDFEAQAVNTAAIKDLNVTRGKIAADAIDGTKLADNAVDSEHYTDGSIDTDHIGNLQVTTSKLADNAVTTVKITDANVTTAKIADSNVTTAKIAADAVNGTKIADNSIDSEHYVDGSIDTAHIGDSQVTTAKLDDNAVTTNKIQNNAVTFGKLATGAIITSSEQSNPSFSGNDTSIFTTSASDARYFNISSGETIKDGQTFPDNDTSIATTAAINDRIIDLVDDVGGFVPIANETSFPTANPDVNNGAGTIVSVSAASTNLAPSGTTVTIANGRGSGLPVIITGVSATIPSGFGFLVETTTTDHTYTFHRLSPKATEVTTVAGISGNVTTVAGIAANTTTVAGISSDVTTVAGIASNVTSVANNESNINSAVSNASNINSAVSNASNINTVAGSISNVNNVGGSISSVNNASSNLNSINNFGDKYQVAANNPSTDGGGNALAAGDLYFNTSANELKVYNGSAWQGGVTATGNFAVTTGNTFTGNNVFTAHTTHNDGVKALFGTGSDLEIFHDGGHSRIKDVGTGGLLINASEFAVKSPIGENVLRGVQNDAAELYYDGVKKLETTSTGITVSGTQHIFTAGTSGDCELILAADSNNSNEEHNARIVFKQDGNAISNSIGVNHPNNTDQNDLYIANGNFNGDIGFWTGFDSNNQNNYSAASLRLNIQTDGDVQIPADNNKLQIGAGQDLEAYHDGTHSYLVNKTNDFHIRSTGDDLILQAQDDLFLRVANGDNALAAYNDDMVALYFDNSAKLETRSNGIYVSGLTETGTFLATSTSEFRNNVKFDGGTPGVDINFFRSTNTLGFSDNAKLKFGGSGDVEVYHDGTNTYFKNSTGDLLLRGGGGNILLQAENGEQGLKVQPNSSVRLYFDNSAKSETYSSGLEIVAGQQLRFPHANATDGNDGTISAGVHGEGLTLVGSRTVSGGNREILHYGRIRPATNNAEQIGAVGRSYGQVHSIRLYMRYDSNTTGLYIGADDDIRSYHDGTNSYLTNKTGSFNIGNTTASSGDLIFTGGGNDILLQAENGENSIVCSPNNQVELYHNGTKKFETDSNGVLVSGRLKIPDNDGNGQQLVVGNSADLKLYHDGSNSYIQHGTVGNLRYQSGNHDFYNQDGTEFMCRMFNNGSVNLYYDNVLRFRTSSIGTNTTGNAVFTGVTGGNTMQINLPDGNSDSVLINGGANQGRTIFRIQAGNATSGSSTSMRFADSSGTDRTTLGHDNDSTNFKTMNLIQGGIISWHTSSTENSSGSLQRVVLSSRGSLQGSGDGHARPAFSFTNDTDSGMYRRGTNNIGFATSGTERYFMGNSAMGPVQDNAKDLGTASNRWDDVRATNGNIVTSDRNEKNTITASDLGLDFVNKLTPVSYKYNNKTRTHYGLIAQDVETLLGTISKSTTDFAGFCKDTVTTDENDKPLETPVDRYGLRYTEFISPMIKAIQELSTEVNNLKTKVAALEAA